MKYSREEVMQYVREEDVKFIRLAFCDVFGRQKRDRTPVRHRTGTKSLLSRHRPLLFSVNRVCRIPVKPNENARNLYHVIAGILEKTEEMTTFFNPNEDSYKRFGQPPRFCAPKADLRAVS